MISTCRHASLPPTLPEPTLQGGDASRGKVTYDTICIACHGPGAVGNQQLNAPPTVGAHDWYLLSQLKKFKAGVRGGDPADVNALLMRPMALQLADEQAMLDVIAHINTLLRAGAQARDVRFIDVGHVLMEPDGSLSKHVMPDGLHLSGKGYALFADAIAPALDPMLAQ